MFATRVATWPFLRIVVDKQVVAEFLLIVWQRLKKIFDYCGDVMNLLLVVFLERWKVRVSHLILLCLPVACYLRAEFKVLDQFKRFWLGASGSPPTCFDQTLWPMHSYFVRNSLSVLQRPFILAMNFEFDDKFAICKTCRLFGRCGEVVRLISRYVSSKNTVCCVCQKPQVLELVDCCRFPGHLISAS